MEHSRAQAALPARLGRSVCLACATFLSVGYLPLIPGTFASLIVLVWFVALKPSPAEVATVAALSVALGFACAGRAEKILGEKDARVIVIDEVAGMSLSLLFVPHNPWFALAAFLVFRVLDTVKPYPVSSLQNLHGAVGIMLDDIVAACYSVIVLQVTFRILLKIPY